MNTLSPIHAALETIIGRLEALKHRMPFWSDRDAETYAPNQMADKCIAVVREELSKQPGDNGLPPITENVYGGLEKHLKALAIRLGKPLIRQSFPGPDAHKLSVDEYAYVIGKVEIMAALGLCKEVESIDSHLPKVRFDAPFAAMQEQPMGGECKAATDSAQPSPATLACSEIRVVDEEKLKLIFYSCYIYQNEESIEKGLSHIWKFIAPYLHPQPAPEGWNWVMQPITENWPEE